MNRAFLPARASARAASSSPSRSKFLQPVITMGLVTRLPDRAFHALRHKERYRTRAADALTDLIKEQVA